MKATNIGKTIIVWNELSDEKAAIVVDTLKEIIINYRELTQNNNFDKPVAIGLFEPNNYLCVLKKHNEVLVCATKISDKQNLYPFKYNAIINADYLYESLPLLRNFYDKMKDHIKILQRFSETKWIELPFNKSFENYCLSPNINPENFIRRLENGTLSETSKDFLRQVGFALEDSQFSKELKEVITEANELFIER